MTIRVVGNAFVSHNRHKFCPGMSRCKNPELTRRSLARRMTCGRRKRQSDGNEQRDGRTHPCRGSKRPQCPALSPHLRPRLSCSRPSPPSDSHLSRSDTLSQTALAAALYASLQCVAVDTLPIRGRRHHPVRRPRLPAGP